MPPYADRLAETPGYLARIRNGKSAGAFPAIQTAARWLVEHCSIALAATFIALGLISTSLLAIEMPPYQNADEPNHFFRAEQISRLRLLPRELSSSGLAGGVSDTGIAQSAVPFFGIPFHYNVKATRALYDATEPVRWGKGVYQAAFPNTSLYPPTLYIPAAIGIWIGKASHSSVIHTLYMARVATGICATLVSGLAILLAGGAAPWLFVVLSLPMTLSLFAAMSQDGMLIALSALAASILCAGLQGRRPMSTGRYAVLCVATAAICMARPPYFPLAFLLLLAPWRRLIHRGLGVGIIGAATAAWSLTVLSIAGIHVTSSGVSINALRQLTGILRHPGQIFDVAAKTFSIYGGAYSSEIIGQLGWLDFGLPIQFQHAAYAILAIAAACCVSGRVQLRHSAAGAATLASVSIAATVLAIFGIQYLTYSPVGSATVEGVQGRYFLTPLLFVACVLLSVGHISRRSWLAPFLVVIALFPIVSLGIMMREIVLRYYL